MTPPDRFTKPDALPVSGRRVPGRSGPRAGALRSRGLGATFAATLAAALALGGCDRLRTGEAASPHARYGRALGADGTAWRAAADSAVAATDSGRAVSVTAPRRLRGALDDAGGTAPRAGVRTWRVVVPRGRVLTVVARADSSVFVDAFVASGAESPVRNPDWSPVRSPVRRPVWRTGLATTPRPAPGGEAADGSARGMQEAGADTLRLEATGTAGGPEGGADTVVVRVHARRGHATGIDLRLATAPVYAFPVAGVDERAVQSRFGVDRDGGARRHEGIDVFAPRGTPVVAATDGIASPGSNRLGGTVVWLRDSERGLSLYHAHLDTALVAPGQRVRRGDTLGTVGTSGNARTTPPHLHFGLYGARGGGRGALDPYPFVAR